MNKRLIVLGTGFAGFRLLKDINTAFYDVTVVSPRNHFLFTPLLPSTTTGTIEFRSIIEPVRTISNISYYQAFCKAVYPENNTILCEDTDTAKEFELTYDELVISIGEITSTFNIPGVKENAYFLKELADARRIRNKVIDCFENAGLPDISPEDRKRYLTFVVCGGGPTGVEFAAELHDFIVEDVKKIYKGLSEEPVVILIEASGKILGSFTEKLSEYAMKAFKRQGITLRTNSYVTKVDPKSVYLKDGSSIDYGLLVWSTGNAPAELIKNSVFKKDERGKLMTDQFFRVKGYFNIFAIGDCAQAENKILPATAQVAQQEGKYLADYFNKLARAKKPRAFKFNNLGMLAYIGGRNALADNPRVQSKGWLTWLFWRSVYLTKLVSFKNKVLVLFDWFKTSIFGRDVSNF
jgi:NADH:ubiquinone reductase (non-electrogenic)